MAIHYVPIVFTCTFYMICWCYIELTSLNFHRFSCTLIVQLLVVLIGIARWQSVTYKSHIYQWIFFCLFYLSFTRLRGSRVLLAGLGGLGAEVAKNLILAGVKGLTLLDHEQVLNTRTPVFTLSTVMSNSKPWLCYKGSIYSEGGDCIDVFSNTASKRLEYNNLH